MSDDHEKHARACLQSRIESMKITLDGEDDENALSLDDILEIKRLQCFEVLLSWGGPSEWIRVMFDGTAIREVSFHYAHWSYHAEVELCSEQTNIIEEWARLYIAPLLNLHTAEGWSHE